MPDFYRDTESRYCHDADFRAAVRALMQVAREHGFTPGELRQIAFKAALELEIERRPVVWLFRRDSAVPGTPLVKAELYGWTVGTIERRADGSLDVRGSSAGPADLETIDQAVGWLRNDLRSRGFDVRDDG